MVLAGIMPVGKWVIKIGGVCRKEERPFPRVRFRACLSKRRIIPLEAEIIGSFMVLNKRTTSSTAGNDGADELLPGNHCHLTNHRPFWLELKRTNAMVI